MSVERTTFGSDFRRFFGRGLAVLLPSILTLWLLWYACVFVFDNVAAPINSAIRWGTLKAAPTFIPADPEQQPEWYRIATGEREEFIRERDGQALRSAPPARIDFALRTAKFREYWVSRWYLSATGLLVAVTLIYLSGKLVGGLVGRRLYATLEAMIGRVPGFKHVYPHIKQLVDMVAGDKPMAFKRVVLVEYPRKGIWSLGLVTSNSLKAVAEQAGGGALTVFIPSTPTPFTGFTINVGESDVVDVPISIDEALRFLLTAGVLIPDQQATTPADPALSLLARQLAGGTDARPPA